MLVRKYARRSDADAGLAALPVGSVYLHEHQEGPGGYVIPLPGRAASRIRARGVFTESACAVLLDRLAAPCVPVPAVVAVQTNLRTVTPGTDALAVAYDAPTVVVAAEETKK